jgi:DNA-binding HxlR family transcriptional regulator
MAISANLSAVSRRPRSSDGLLLALLADGDCRLIVDRLLEGDATQRELRDELGLQSGSLSRQMRVLEDAAMVVRERSHGPYELIRPERTRAVLQAAADLAADLSAARQEVDAERARSVRKSGMRAPAEARVREGA